MKNLLISVLLMTSAIIVSPDGNTATVYQWTDADGVVHFSDTAPPQDGATKTREIKFDNLDDAAPVDQTYSIIEQAKMMAEMRKQETEQLIALKQLELEQQALSQQVQGNQQENQTSVQEAYQSAPYFYFFPQLTRYRYPGQWHNRPHPAEHQPGPRLTDRPAVKGQFTLSGKGRSGIRIEARF